ncbi:hypothetical protein MLD38_013435 [Melastoma candidum]|uniref:Uncharacterized protein n=1 Tax=Melastoma candidum TaxID=119954 RepID=A0ACB9RBE3_9MYRT|nr:hypothetical protein MLD38_013435 [Melastoma candidum]
MSSLLWEDPREEPGSNLRRRRPGRVHVRCAKPLNPPLQRRPKKVGGTRTWLRIDCTGGSELVDVGKQSIMRMTGLSARDLRILDPMLSYPSSITAREGAIVVNLESVKGVVTACNFWLLNPKDPGVLPFVAELQRRAKDHHESNNPEVVRDEANDGAEEVGKDKLKNSPFEFVALETCLETVCNCLDYEAASMEKEAYPVLDKLTSKISRRKLDRVRHIKGRLVALTARVQKVRDLIERLLEDSDDMAEMYLMKKLMLLQQDGSSCVSSLTDDENDNQDEQGQEGERRDYENGETLGMKGSISTSALSYRHQPEVGELEMILEPYLVQAEGALNKLSTLKEYVDDTEDYVNIMMDDKQNKLLKMGIMISTATLMMTFVIIVAGIFGMNIHIPLFLPPNPTINNWLYTAVGCIASSTVMYIATIAWYKHKRLV